MISSRNDFTNQRMSAKVIQRFYCDWKVLKSDEENNLRHFAASEIQRIWRGRKVRKERLAQFLVAFTLLQANTQVKYSMKDFALQISSPDCIQNVHRLWKLQEIEMYWPLCKV